MLAKSQKNSFETSMFHKINMKINKNLPKVYFATLLFAVIVVLLGNN